MRETRNHTKFFVYNTLKKSICARLEKEGGNYMVNLVCFVSFCIVCFVSFCVLFVCKCVVPPGGNPIAV